jgi:hypothetical protein
MGGYGGDYEDRDKTFDPFQEALANAKKELQKRIQTEKNLKGSDLKVPDLKAPDKPVIAQAGLTPDEMIAGSSRAGTFDAMTKDATSGIPLADLRKKAQEEAPKGQFDTFLEEVAQGRKDLAEQRKEDKNMALLAAGLGMLGGSSQYAFENIGKGGLSGVQYLSEANKQRAAEKAALDKSQVTALRYKDLADISKGGRESALGIRMAELNRKIRDDNMDAIGRLEKNSLAKATAALRAQGILGVENINDPQIQKQLNDWVQNDLANNKAYNKLYQDAFGFGYDVSPQASSGSNVRKYDSKGKEIK